MGTGLGTFERAPDLDASWPIGMVGVDLNDDAGFDLVVRSFGSEEIRIFYGASNFSISRGDVDGDGVVFPFLDAIALLSYGFVGTAPVPPCLDAADIDDNGGVVPLLDALYLLNFGFIPGSPAIPPPFTCDVDPTLDGISCMSSACP